MRKISQLLLILSLGLILLGSISCLSSSDSTQNDSSPTAVLIPAGEFEMVFWDEVENQKSTRAVFVPDVYLDVHKVSNAEYARCVQAGVCQQPVNPRFFEDSEYQNHPVVYLTREMAETYCNWRGARLPTKAEWEKAAGEELSDHSYYWGDTSPVCQAGARMGAEGDPGEHVDPQTSPVDQASPNPYGLYRMTEGVWEWVGDDSGLEIYDYSPETVSFLRIYRTGGYGPLYERFFCGFRCASSSPE